MYESECRIELSQGDIFHNIDLIDSAVIPATPSQAPPSQKRTIIVLSHDCEIDKPYSQIVLVCGIRSLLEVNIDVQRKIRLSQVLNCMYLLGSTNMQESFIDFRYTFRVSKTYLIEAMNRGLRLCSVTDEIRLVLAMSYYRFLSRREFKENFLKRAWSFLVTKWVEIYKIGAHKSQ